MPTVPRSTHHTYVPVDVTAYAFAYVTQTPDRSGANHGLHLAVSRDGLHWSPLNQNRPVSTPTAGRKGLREPFVHRRQDGSFVVAALDLTGPGPEYLHIWDTTDLARLTGYRHVRLGAMDTHAWGLTIFWDAARHEYGITWSAARGNRDVLMVAHTADFRTVSTPLIYFDPGSPIPGGADHGLSPGAARAPLNQRDYTPPLNAEDGSIVGITDAEYHAMVDRWGLPAWTRLKSWNFPDRFVRHYNGSVRLDAYPFDPHQDQQWHTVPGLADSGGVSFESVNRPGHYLRRNGVQTRLDASDGTAAFHADATFLRTTGLAHPGWTSLRSYSLPTHYLRHSGYVLRLDPLGGTLNSADRQDATFRFVS
jgi:hypothetical protein